MTSRFPRPIFFWLFLVFLSACATSPEGRQQLILLPESQMNEMGVQGFSEIKQKERIETDPKVNRYVRCVANAVAAQATGKTVPEQWEIVVFASDQANAFALPGGKIGVYTGLLKVAKTPDQLAAVLGHEVGHVTARHGNERVSAAFATQGALSAIDVALKNKRGDNYGLIMAGLGLGAQFGVLMPHGRLQESEADIIGLGLMTKAGFNPEESVTLWENMRAAAGKQQPEFLSTHPSPDNRIANLRKHMAKLERPAQVTRPDCRM